MVARECEKCKNTQYAFFTSHKEYDEWVCPVCKGEGMEDMEIKELEKDGQKTSEKLDKEVQDVYDDLEDKKE